MAVVLTLVQTKQIRINIHKRINTKIHYKQHKTQQIQVHILPKHPHITKPTHTHNHTLHNPHITKPTPTHTHTLHNPHIHTPMRRFEAFDFAEGEGGGSYE